MFVVQENHRAHKYTRIHKVGCSFAKPNGHTTKNTRWYPRRRDVCIDDELHAMAIAQTLGQPNGPYRCQHCLRLFTRAEEAEYRRTALALLADQQNSLKSYTSDGIADDGSI